ncbi:AAA family ATPase [Mycobacterium sp. SMC-4]|uniref:AAA family ATPase n=1 Tax=Mycobacterium sp. SMC-4 TaxID=2857059 RepID=UPI0021B2A617|nr:AAA family ATPase [Mycobacterium sp. SMC-4]UXA17452.1 AAA family ATPase [Mycobacterium sp. SMC-4]
MVSQAHRLLHQQQPGSVATPRIWVLHGPPVLDLYFHNLYHGSVTLRRTIELWGLEDWGGDPAPITVTLTSSSDLDFSGNADPTHARQRFEAMGTQRAAPPGLQPRTRRARDSGAASDEAESAAASAAEGARSSIGSGQGLINRMQQVSAALRSQNGDRIVVIVDDLSYQLQRLQIQNQADAVLQAQQILRVEWVTGISPRNALLFFTEFRRSNLESHLSPDIDGVRWGDPLKGPSEHEVREALLRLARRKRFEVSTPAAVARSLSGLGSLRTALGHVSRIVDKGDDVNLATVLDLPEIDQTAVEHVLAELEVLIGLDNVKAKARELRRRAEERHRRLAAGELPEETLHMVFTGAPGTGKTSVAKIFAKLYHALGLLRSDRVKVVAPHDLKSSVVGKTRENMQRAVEDALGGVLFIDEVHQFSIPGVGEQDDTKSREAAEALVPLVWNHRTDLVVILAGYAQEISGFFKLDPGLPRRFPDAGRLTFADYTPDQLWEIFHRRLTGARWRIDPAAEAPLRSLLDRRARRAGFGNAGGVANLVDEVLAQHAANEDRSRLLTPADVPDAIVSHPLELQRAQRALDSLVGIAPIRQMIDEIVAGLAYDIAEGRPPEPSGMNLLFVGPPGTGKTTVAKLMSGLLYGHGAIRSDQCLPVTGTELQGQFKGQSAAKVVDLMEKCRNGVLIVDEAYSMHSGGHDSYGSEVINTLVGELTKPENAETVVILAGYESHIDELVGRNPGLASRFEKKVRFANYSPDDCAEIARREMQRLKYTTGDGFLERLSALAQQAMLEQGELFGNARWVRSTVKAAIDKMKVRVMTSNQPPEDPKRTTVELVDLENVDLGRIDAVLAPVQSQFGADQREENVVVANAVVRS